MKETIAFFSFIGEYKFSLGTFFIAVAISFLSNITAALLFVGVITLFCGVVNWLKSNG